jgi:hypothetical protein
MTAVCIKHAIALPAFACIEITLRTARWNPFTEVQARNDPVGLQVGKSRFRLLGIRAVCADQAFNGFVCTGARLPIWIMLSNSCDGVSRCQLCLG